MSKIKIITDSNSGILQAESYKYGIFVIPMPFTINGEEYFEEVSISQEEFYGYLSQNAEVTTSQPSRFYLEELWEDLLKTNDELIYIPMSSGLSKTCANAREYAKKYNGRVHVVDNNRISVTQKLSVLEAVEMVNRGFSAKEIKDYLESSGKTSSIYIMVDVLKYLKKGGRISPAVAAVGEMLKLKPILYSKGECFEKFGIALSPNQGKKKILDQIKKELSTVFKEEYEQGKMVLSVAHTQNLDLALRFKAQAQEELPNLKFKFVDALSLSVSCHIGPGALGVALAVNNYVD